jgi:hypothetical protein
MIPLKEVLVSRANDVLNSRHDTVLSNLKIFFEFLDSDVLLKSIKQELMDNLPDAKPMIDKWSGNRQITLPASYLEKVKTCFAFLVYSIENNYDPWGLMVMISREEDINMLTTEAMHEFFDPVAKYFEEKITAIDSFQYLLIRFKAQTEWFERENLLSRYSKDTGKGESVLDLSLREYLFNQGVDFPFSKPSSPSGEVDVLSIVKQKPIPLEVKVFDNEGRTQAHVKQGVVQAFCYAKDYGETCAYLVVFNVSDREVLFKLSSLDVPQRIVIGDKTIYIFVINLFNFKDTASKRKIEPAIIEEKYLLEPEPKN